MASSRWKNHRPHSNAVDIGEQVAFVVTGLFREFSDSSHPAGVPPDAAPDGTPESF